MRHARERRLEIYASALRGLLTLESDWNKQRTYLDFVDAYADLREDEVARYRAEYIDKTEDTNMGLVATLLRRPAGCNLPNRCRLPTLRSAVRGELVEP